MRIGEAGEVPRGEDGGMAAPSADFRRLCAEQLEMFRAVVSRDAVLSVSPDFVRNLTRNSKDMRAVYTTLAANYWSLFLMNAKFDSGLLFQLLWINR